MEQKSFYLKTFNVGANLADAQIHELSSVFAQKEGRKGQAIFSDASERKVFLLVSGKVKISEIDSSGDEMIKEIISPGDLFGDVMLTNDLGSCECAEIISERAIFLSVTQENLLTLMKTSHLLTMNYMSKVSEKFRNLESRYLNMISKDVKSRLIYCFKEWARKEGRKSGDKVIVKNSLTHNDLANLISTSRQTVTVILNELKESGKINYNRKEIEFSQYMLAS
jgi:CRP/FNR family cyclic AMP-dependent transcriptional regulator